MPKVDKIKKRALQIKADKDNPLDLSIIEKMLTLQNRYYVYDIETYPNVFTFAIEDTLNPNKKRVYEISENLNEYAELMNLLLYLKGRKNVLVGFNNLGFDYPVVHNFMTECSQFMTGGQIALQLYNKAKLLIDTGHFNPIGNIIWHKQQEVKQCDLYKIHHFDNAARRTSLKLIEFNLRMHSIQDLPFKPGEYIITQEDINNLKLYNQHDTTATANFFRESISQIKFREELGAESGRWMQWDNDKKIGSEFFIRKLEAEGIQCYTKDENGRQPRQTPRSKINLGEVIFPVVGFKTHAFQAVHQWLASQTIYETNGVFSGIPYKSLFNGTCVNFETRAEGITNPSIHLTHYMDSAEIEAKLSKVGEDAVIDNLHVVVNGFQFDFGTGGIHGSIPAGYVEASIPAPNEDEMKAKLKSKKWVDDGNTTDPDNRDGYDMIFMKKYREYLLDRVAS